MNASWIEGDRIACVKLPRNEMSFTGEYRPPVVQVTAPPETECFTYRAAAWKSRLCTKGTSFDGLITSAFNSPKTSFVWNLPLIGMMGTDCPNAVGSPVTGSGVL